jgi:hypothetical protein
MSILQEYERQRDLLGQKTIGAISAYLDYLDKKGTTLFYSDIIYKKEIKFHEKINCYYSFENDIAYILQGDVYFLQYSNNGYYDLNGKFYIKQGTVVSHDGRVLDLSLYGSKYLSVSVRYEQGSAVFDFSVVE